MDLFFPLKTPLETPSRTGLHIQCNLVFINTAKSNILLTIFLKNAL